MNARVIVDKSFDDKCAEFEKVWEDGDFEKFFREEGKYLDKLSKITKEKGNDGEGFVITYTIMVKA